MTVETRQSSEKNEYLLGYASTQQQRDQRESMLPVDPTRYAQPYAIVLVDASADASSSMQASPRLRLLPLAVRWPGRTMVEKGTSSRLRRLSRERLRGAVVAAPEVDSLEYRLYPPLAINADYLIHLGTRREFVDMAPPLQQLLARHADDIRELRRQRGLDDQLPLQLVDTGTLLAGTALHARMLLRMLEAGIAPAEAARRAQALRDTTRTWLVPQHPGDTLLSLRQLQQPALQPWEQACSSPLGQLWRRHPVLEADASGLSCRHRLKTWRAAVGHVFAQACELMRAQSGPGAWLQISLDGGLRDMQAWPEFEALRAQALATRTSLHLTHMSPAGRIWASAGSLSMALYQPPGS